MNNILPYGLLVISVTMAAFSQVLLKKSALKTYKSKIYEYLNPYVIVGYGIIFLSMILSIVAYGMVDYKNGPLMETLGFVLVVILSYLFFKEKITSRKLLGSIFIICGIVIFYL